MEQQVHWLVEHFVRQLDHTQEDAVSPDAQLTELGIDSLSLVDLLFRLERTFGVSIPDSALDRISTVADLTAYVVAAAR